MFPPMRRGRRLVVAVVLLAALLMAAQPLIVALSQSLRAIADAAELSSVVICTDHGAVTLSDEAGDGKGPPARKPPDCPLCVLGCGAANPKVLLVGATSEPLLTPNAVEVIAPAFDFHQASQPLLRLVTSPPRAPPRA